MVLFVGRSCPTFVQVFDCDGHDAIENLNEFWTRSACNKNRKASEREREREREERGERE